MPIVDTEEQENLNLNENVTAAIPMKPIASPKVKTVDTRDDESESSLSANDSNDGGMDSDSDMADTVVQKPMPKKRARLIESSDED